MNVLDQFKLIGKKAMVTGGGSGIGRSYCHALAEAGADVAVVDIDPEAAKKVSEELLEHGNDSFPIQADIADENSIDSMMKKIENRWSCLDIAVNNAGISHKHDAEVVPMEVWDNVMNINLRGSFMCAQKEAKIMIPNRYGKIIFTVSISASIVNTPHMHVAYGTSKAGIQHLVKDLAYEWIKYGINVNGISPGAVYTPLIEKRLPELIPVWEDMYPIKRLGRTDELKGALVFLASDASTFMVGHCLVLDGGYTLL